MENSGLHRYAILVAIVMLLLVITGAAVTSNSEAQTARVLDQAVLQNVHRGVGVLGAVLVLGLAIWLAADRKSGLAWFGWITLVVVIAEGGLGELTAIGPVWHAILAQVLLSMTAVIATATSARWRRGPEIVKDQGWPSLRSLAIVTPVVVLAQVGFGAALRHKVASGMMHFAGALVVALLVVMWGVFVTQQFPEHPSLRQAAVTMMTATFVQVFLGITVLTMQMMIQQNSLSMIATTVTHVFTGAIALAATTVLAVLVRRNVHGKVSDPSEENPES